MTVPIYNSYEQKRSFQYLVLPDYWRRSNLMSEKWHLVISMSQVELNWFGQLDHLISKVPANSTNLFPWFFIYPFNTTLFNTYLCQPGTLISTKDTHMNNISSLSFYLNGCFTSQLSSTLYSYDRDFGIRCEFDSWFYSTNYVTLGKLLYHSKLPFLHLLREQEFHLPHRTVRIRDKGKYPLHNKYSILKFFSNFP